MQQDLRYNKISDATLARWNTVLATSRVTDRARRLLTLALQSCDAAGPVGLQAKLHSGNLWIRCEQERLAVILGCSDRSIRREFSRLEAAGALKRVQHEELENVVGWAISLERLESIPESETPELDELICACPDPFETRDERREARDAKNVSTLDARLSDSCLSAPVSGGLSGGLSAPVSGGLSGLMIMKHAHEHDNKQKTHEHDHESFRNLDSESQPGEAGERLGVSPPCDTERGTISFGQIHPGDAKRIVRQSDFALFQRHFDDALAAGWARDSLDERLRMAGLFHQVIRIGLAKNIGATIAGAWRNRDSLEKTKRGKPKALILSQEDQDFASKLLRPGVERREARDEIRSFMKVLPHDDTDDVSPVERARINALKAGNLAVLSAMR